MSGTRRKNRKTDIAAPTVRGVLVKITAYAVIFGSLIAKGAFFNAWVIILNLFFIALILFQKHPLEVDINALLLTGLFICALISALFLADNPYIAMSELIKYALYPLGYLAFLNFEDKRSLENIFYRAVIFLGAAGLLAVAGFSPIPDMVIQNGLRLQSFLQYANTTALLLSAGTLMAIHYFLASKDWIHIVSAAVTGTALVLTKSRVGFWVFLAVLALMVFKRMGRKGRIAFAAAAGILIVAFALLGYRTLRVSLLEPTLIERVITFYDAVNALKTNIFGLGLGDWQLEQTLFQSAPYYVKYIHSGYLNIALDCGIGGLICFGAVIAAALARGMNSIYFYIILLIAAGSALDVNLSFGFVIAFCMLALSAIGSRHVFTIKKRAALFSLLAPAALLTIFLLSETAVYIGDRGSETPEAAMSAYAAAGSLNPWNYRVKLGMARLEPDFGKALGLLERGFEQNSLDKEFVLELCRGYSFTGDWEKATHFARLGFELRRYSADTQRNLSEKLGEAKKSGYLPPDEYNARLSGLMAEIESLNEAIHPLYRYINPQMKY